MWEDHVACQNGRSGIRSRATCERGRLQGGKVHAKDLNEKTDVFNANSHAISSPQYISVVASTRQLRHKRSYSTSQDELTMTYPGLLAFNNDNKTTDDSNATTEKTIRSNSPRSR
ncbi:uncharacterized protein RCC_05610 [Ramularia collo-cygni]|uniref:Uncharacterized protein n=1 Tax=Ramularia collo-cygni TaxID=112498 RepID=A0A2D3UZ95_9PEZI|nr:uncharacterized protein RCC_05610 [Ramularia collo-cygni]CZT19755.1 uncharacterized protein RCC_05610 [Ramularia collo-cygni]